MIFLYNIAIITGALTLFINYCIGKPGSKEFSPYEIFSFYTIWLCKMRLKKMGLYSQYSDQYHENLERLENVRGAITLKNDFKKIIYDAAEPFFTWERAFGMCPICSGFWISLACGLYVTHNFLYVGSIIVLSHIVIRILNKIL